ncbi:MlaD family protein [Henriciella marina]|uniref:MlaD family protein n=1 Tax=Henriciella marina TaxID=453851 RepID=A0ABT4LX15_9PROT|nr:MlaD family protein [Henriciella marina]MCZ4298914.1 MlaD family protein [Henriciella marina]
MRESALETIIGAAVLGVAAVFMWFAIGNGTDRAEASSGTVELGARFNSAKGINVGTEVSMAGVKVGTVRNIRLNTERAEALVTLAISRDLVPLDDGTTARIQSEGLLGGSYINLEPASGFGQIEPCPQGEELFGESGCGEILYTQGSVDLLTLMASFASGSGDDDSSSPASGSYDDPMGSPADDGDVNTESPQSNCSVSDTEDEPAGETE